MKRFNLILLAVTFMVSVLAVSCQSDSEWLKSSAKDLDKIAEELSSAKDAGQYEKLVVKAEKIMNNIPSSLKEMDEEEFAKVDGGEEFLLAAGRVESAEIAAASKFASEMFGSLKDLFSDEDDSDDDD